MRQERLKIEKKGENSILRRSKRGEKLRKFSFDQEDRDDNELQRTDCLFQFDSRNRIHPTKESVASLLSILFWSQKGILYFSLPRNVQSDVLEMKSLVGESCCHIL